MRLLPRLRPPPHERAGFTLYTAAVTASRDPAYFTVLGVPDTFDGRFDLTALFAAVLIRRLRTDAPPGPALAQAVFDAMFADMDWVLREQGVSDFAIARKMKQAWEGFHGRARAYEAALDSGNGAALAAALARNVWRGNPPEDGPARLAAVARAQAAGLAGQELAALAAGTVQFVAPGAAVGQ